MFGASIEQSNSHAEQRQSCLNTKMLQNAFVLASGAASFSHRGLKYALLWPFMPRLSWMLRWCVLPVVASICNACYWDLVQTLSLDDRLNILWETAWVFTTICSLRYEEVTLPDKLWYCEKNCFYNNTNILWQFSSLKVDGCGFLITLLSNVVLAALSHLLLLEP
jgi:hypothetical protein